VTVATAISTVSPTYVTATLSAGTNGTVNIYYNGALEATGTPPSGSPAIVTDTTPFLIGTFPGGNFFHGAQFCVRVSNIARSAAWITYTNTVLSSATGGVASMTIAADLGVSATASTKQYFYPVTARIGDSAGVTWTINENNIWGADEWNPWAYGLNHPFRLRRIRGLQRMTPYAPQGYDQ
jgi:hypothetical protein